MYANIQKNVFNSNLSLLNILEMKRNKNFKKHFQKNERKCTNFKTEIMKT